MPRYELEITDPEGGAPAETTHDSDDSLDAGDTFEYQGGTLAVTAVEAAGDASFDAEAGLRGRGRPPALLLDRPLRAVGVGRRHA